MFGETSLFYFRIQSLNSLFLFLENRLNSRIRCSGGRLTNWLTCSQLISTNRLIRKFMGNEVLRVFLPLTSLCHYVLSCPYSLAWIQKRKNSPKRQSANSSPRTRWRHRPGHAIQRLRVRFRSLITSHFPLILLLLHVKNLCFFFQLARNFNYVSAFFFLLFE